MSFVSTPTGPIIGWAHRPKPQAQLDKELAALKQQTLKRDTLDVCSGGECGKHFHGEDAFAMREELRLTTRGDPFYNGEDSVHMCHVAADCPMIKGPHSRGTTVECEEVKHTGGVCVSAPMISALRPPRRNVLVSSRLR